MYSQSDISRVQRLLNQGHSYKTVAKRTGISRHTVSKFARRSVAGWSYQSDAPLVSLPPIQKPISEDVERPSIADLECYGLSESTINAIEETLDAIYIDELRHVTAEMLMSRSRYLFGPVRINELKSALERWKAGTPIKTPEECVSFSS
jgi:DNA-binding MurR/RpiR family transcriptional regulator